MEPNDFYKNSNHEVVQQNKTNYVGKRHQRLQEKINENQEHIKSINMSNHEELNELDLSNESYIAKIMDRPSMPSEAYKPNNGSRSNLNKSTVTTISKRSKQRSIKPGVVKKRAGFFNVYDPESLLMFAPKPPNFKQKTTRPYSNKPKRKANLSRKRCKMMNF